MSWFHCDCSLRLLIEGLDLQTIIPDILFNGALRGTLFLFKFHRLLSINSYLHLIQLFSLFYFNEPILM